MTVKKKVQSHPDVVAYFKELLFYNKHIEKPKIKRLQNTDLLFELPFYEELNVIKTNHAFRGYAMSYKVEITEKKDPIKQLEASKLSIKDLFRNLLNETKGFKYQITLKIMLKKYKTTHINAVKIHPERITWEIKNLLIVLIMMELNFL